jgi:hypothetical protein
MSWYVEVFGKNADVVVEKIVEQTMSETRQHGIPQPIADVSKVTVRELPDPKGGLIHFKTSGHVDGGGGNVEVSARIINSAQVAG